MEYVRQYRFNFFLNKLINDCIFVRACMNSIIGFTKRNVEANFDVVLFATPQMTDELWLSQLLHITLSKRKST